jgi:hypothetical protein
MTRHTMRRLYRIHDIERGLRPAVFHLKFTEWWITADISHGRRLYFRPIPYDRAGGCVGPVLIFRFVTFGQHDIERV